MSLTGGLTTLVTDFVALKSRRVARLAALGLSAWALVMTFFGLTLMFGCLGLFLALEPNLGGPGAAFAVAGMTLTLALVILLAAFVALRRSRRPRRRAVAPVAAAPPPGGPVPPGAPPATPPGAAPAAKGGGRRVPVAAASGFLTGFLTGRATDKTPPRR